MLSNPVNPFINGNDTKPFTYNHQTDIPRAYHFSSKDNGLSDHRHCEVIFFAHCIEDAKDILKRMFQHQIDCSNQYLSVANPTNRHYDFYKDQNENNVSKWQRYLDALDDIELIEVPTNQFYKVGWADNDTI